MKACFAHEIYSDHTCTDLCTDNDCCQPGGKNFMVTLHLWVDGVTDEAAARKAVNRMVDTARDVKNNGDADIERVVEWDYEG